MPVEVRVFKTVEGGKDENHQQTGLRALINGQSHAKRDANFFKTGVVDLEHIAGSMLVTLDCTGLGQDSRNALFMSNREQFRDDPLLKEMFKKLQKELRDHEGLQALNQKRYEEKIANATSDEDGINALEELLSTDPSLADLFGSMVPGKVAAKIASAAGPTGYKVTAKPEPFKGTEFPSYFKRASGATSVEFELPRGSDVRVSFLTDVKNNYFSRAKHRGTCKFHGPIEPTFHLFNGRLTFTFHGDKRLVEGTILVTHIEISDKAGHGPFKLLVKAKVAPPRPKTQHQPPQNNSKVDDTPSRPDIVEVMHGPDGPPITIEKVPNTTRLQLQVNKESRLLAEAKELRPKEEAIAVEFVFKYGLVLIAMGLLDAAKRTPAWAVDEAACRKSIQEHAAGAGRVIVPLCLTLPKKLPKVA